MNTPIIAPEHIAAIIDSLNKASAQIEAFVVTLAESTAASGAVAATAVDQTTNDHGTNLRDDVDGLRDHETEEAEETEDAPGSVVGTWRKRPITIEAAQLTGDTAHDLAVYQWIANNTLGPFEPLEVLEGRVPAPASGVAIDPSNSDLLISTLEGVMRARTGWWVIRGVEGEFYPCDPSIFTTTYEAVS